MDGKQSKTGRLKQNIANIDTVIPGYIRIIYQQCGQPNCRCKKKKKYRHGPYYLWGRRVNGKLTSKSIRKKDVPLYKQWIKNRAKLKAIVSELLNAGLQYATVYNKKNKTTTKG